MVHAPCAKLIAHFLRRREAKVGDCNSQSTIETEDVLRLQVPVIDAENVAILDGIKDLQENVPYEVVVGEVPTMVEDLGEQVAVGGVFHDDEGVRALFYDAMEGDNVRVFTGQLMNKYLAHV